MRDENNRSDDATRRRPPVSRVPQQGHPHTYQGASSQTGSRSQSTGSNRSSAVRQPGKPHRRPVVSPLSPQAVIARDFHSRLHGKPTHAAHSHAWHAGLLAFFLSITKFILVALLIISFVFGGFGGGMLIAYVSTAEALTLSDFEISDAVLTSHVYDINGDEIAKLTGSENVDRVYVSFSSVKDTYIDEAIISIEDERFYEHNGIDVQRIGSAILSAVANGGSATHGGSTITQQVVKLISGDDQRSAQRKVQEWYRAMNLEQQLTKDEILDYYINLAPMGNNYVGIQAAALNYFGKDAKDLTLVECAFLAGLPKSPSYYNPLRETGRRNAMRRMRIVLSKMHELGKITDEEYEAALNTELVFKTSDTTTATTINSYFVEYAVEEVISDLQEERNISQEMAATLVYNRGYKIYTTLEPTVQSSLDSAFMNQDLFQSDPEAIEDYPEKPTAGMVVINVETGAIAGMQGGYGEKIRNLGTNLAVDAYRQPGSSIKPLIDYAPALEVNLVTTATVYEDKAYTTLDPSNPGVVWPKNSSDHFYGPLTIRSAIAKSSNVIAVIVWEALNNMEEGLPLWYLKQVGIDRTDEVYPATAIGGFSIGMSPLEMAAAYATFPSGGVYREPYAYTTVEDSEGNVILDKTTQITSTKVYSAETCFLITSMLEDVITSGTATGNVLPIENDAGETIEVAGKTGTTDSNVDKWFCGYTPYYAAATWYGYENRLRTTTIPSGQDRNNAMRIWNDVMQNIHNSLPGATFTMPDDIVSLQVCTSSGLLATPECIAAGTAVTDYFVEGDYLTPDTSCTIHSITPTPTPDPSAPAT